MKSYRRFQIVHNRSPFWISITRSLFLLGISVWFGSLVFFAAGVAPVNFEIAQTWELTGENPQQPEQPIGYRTIGGALTQESLARLNTVELIGILLSTIGLFMAWVSKQNRNGFLITQTLVLACMILIYLIYAFQISGRMHEIQSSVVLDFTLEKMSEKPALHQEFDRLHERYTTFTSINAFLLFAQIILFSVNPLIKQRT